VRSTFALGLLWVFLATAIQATGQSQPYATTRSPHGDLNIPCQNCHTSLGWKPIRGLPEFDHNLTKFPLRGMHQGVTCTQCHTKPVFTNVGIKCADCHADIHKRQFGANCEQCHTVNGWQMLISQVKEHQNRFPLLGAHAALDCSSCHTGAAVGQFQGLSTQCYSCHAKDYKATTVPNHVTAGFSTSCEQCHTMNDWAGAKFDHAAVGFPLTNAHAVPPRQCADCHIGGKYNLTTTACVSCHLKDFQAATNPNHVTARFSQTCQSCHSTIAWQPASFDHNAVNFPLTGAHAVPPRQCADCHANNNYNLTSTSCVSCHLKDYQGTTNPNHAKSGIPQTCEVCHNTSAWQPAQFDHSKTAFPLTGMHTVPPRQCADCHINNNYNITSTACVSCHLKDYQGAKDPDHVAAGFPQTCEQCHSTSSWNGASFDHAQTGFPLTGQHTVPPRQCADCHVNNNYKLTNTACVGCHLKDYQGAKDPDHVAAGFPQTCESCHSTSSWNGASFDHAQTGFALTGSHLVPPRQCTDCHVNNNYKLTNTACVSCHQTDYNNAKSPVDHISAGFPTSCELCHDTSVWTNGKFDHNQTAFPLTGKHTVPPRQCADCHVNNNYTTLPTDCYGCHKPDYLATSNPGHAAQPQFFPTTCADCHNTSDWMKVNFNHAKYTPFPMNHGNANGVCSTCHINSNDYSVFQCTNCHGKSQTDADHRGINGYVYNSVNCYQCHRNGQGG